MASYYYKIKHLEQNINNFFSVFSCANNTFFAYKAVFVEGSQNALPCKDNFSRFDVNWCLFW